MIKMGYREKYNRLLAKQKFLLEEQNRLEERLKTVRRENVEYVQAREAINEISKTVLTKLLGWIEEVVSEAVGQVYSGYSFKFVPEVKRNQLELKPVVVKDGVEYPPEYSVGGGMLDIISVCLRVVVWAAQKEKTIPVFFLDEPMKFMGSYSRIGAEILKQLAKKMNLQFIVVTHNTEMVEMIGDDKENSVKVFRFVKNGGATQVKVC